MGHTEDAGSPDGLAKDVRHLLFTEQHTVKRDLDPTSPDFFRHRFSGGIERLHRTKYRHRFRVGGPCKGSIVDRVSGHKRPKPATLLTHHRFVRQTLAETSTGATARLLLILRRRILLLVLLLAVVR